MTGVQQLPFPATSLSCKAATAAAWFPESYMSVLPAVKHAAVHKTCQKFCSLAQLRSTVPNSPMWFDLLRMLH
jgi:hypothetical protein